MPIFALVDCNNFYASCERAFQPALERRPVCVLSNNDGCIIARSNEAKALGIKMGDPWHQRQAFCKEHGVAVFSSNYALYGDMSRRVMSCLSQFTPEMEIYSIDEAFLLLDGFEHLNLTDYARTIKRTVRQWTHIPVSISIGPTKTLAKVANNLAKQQQKKGAGNGVLDLCDRERCDAVLETFEVEEIWGVGRRWAARLLEMGIVTAAQLRDAEPKYIRQNFNVVLERIVYELRGVSCLGLEDIQPKKNIMASRSFGRMVTKKVELLEAIACHGARAAEKLRRQQSRAGGLSVFLKTNKYSKTDPQYSASNSWSFVCPTSDSREIIKAASRCMELLYRPGFRYQKCGVMLMDIASKNVMQGDLFAKPNYKRRDTLMKLVDQLNMDMGRGTITFAAQGIKHGWQMRQSLRSQRYTTRLDELVKVSC